MELLKNDSCSEFKLPAKNPFIPQSFSIDHEKFEGQVPMKISENIWLLKDTKFLLPKIIGKFIIGNEDCFELKASCSMLLLIEMMKDVLDESLYDASLAGFNFQIGLKTEGLEISLSGFSDKFDVFVNEFFRCLASLSLSPSRFSNYKEKTLRKLKSAVNEVPYWLISQYSTAAIQKPFHLFTDQIPVVEMLEFSDIQNYLKDLLNRNFLECFFFGNINTSKCSFIAGKIQEILHSSRIKRNKIVIKNVPVGKEIIEIPGENLLNSAIDNYIQVFILSHFRFAHFLIGICML